MTGIGGVFSWPFVGFLFFFSYVKIIVIKF